MSSPPTGTVTFLFTDIEGSTRLAQQHPAAWPSAQARHHAILQGAIEAHGGHIFQTIGDAFCAAFHTAPDALAAALDAQRSLLAESWDEAVVRVRMGLHAGAAIARADGDYDGYLTLVRVQRIMSAAFGGQTLLSRDAHELLHRDLPAGIGLRDAGTHRLKDLATPEHLYQLVAPGLPTDFPPLKTADCPNNLPTQLTSFIGRDAELAEARRLLGGTRLLSLTGAGGVGKTRLALHLAAAELATFPDGVWFVELAPLADPALIPHSLATVLGVREEATRPMLDTLGDYFHAKTALLVLDNCEHLIAGAARVCDALLHAAPHLSITATSREPLGIAGEHAYRVPSLAYPEDREPLDVLTHTASVQLFADRAQAVKSNFAITDASAPAVAQICRRLDGIPLAIELAAARIRALSPDQIASRLDDRFRLLTGGSRTALPRQQTLLAAIDWSYNLLTEPERILLRRLSVFAGGWTLEAAEAVCSSQKSDVSSQVQAPEPFPDLATDYWLLKSDDVLDLLTRLVDKSLVLADEQDGIERYRMLETVRQYAQDKLVAANEMELARTQHAAFFVQFAERVEPELFRQDQRVWLNRVEQEHDNVRAALSWVMVPESVEMALRLGNALAQFWLVRGYWTEERRWLHQSLDIARTGLQAGAMSSFRVAFGRAASHESIMAWTQGDFTAARTLLDESLTVLRPLDDHKGIAYALFGWGITEVEQGNIAPGRRCYEESLEHSRMAGDEWGIANALGELGNADRQLNAYAAARAYLLEALALFRKLGDQSLAARTIHYLSLVERDQGDLAAARAHAEEAVALARAVDFKRVICVALNNLAPVALAQGDDGAAAAAQAESMELFRELGEQWGIAASLSILGQITAAKGDYETARTHWQESMARAQAVGDKRIIARNHRFLAHAELHAGHMVQAVTLARESLAQAITIGDKREVVECLVVFAGLAAANRQYARTTRLAGTVEAHLSALGAALDRLHRMLFERTVANLCTQLGAAAFERAWSEGRAWTLDQAIADAQRDMAAEDEVPSESIRSPAYPAGLTEREVEVLRLLARGFSNAEIGDQLVISPRTVAAHLRSIYGKLDVTTRTAAIRAASALKIE